MKWAILILLALLAGCTTTKDANVAVGKRFLGTKADDFFVSYGPPASSYKMQDGSSLYTWAEGARHFSTPGMATTNVVGNTAFTTYSAPGDITVQCSIKMVVNPTGTITSISVLNDSLGVWQLSRCNEVFSKRGK